MQGGLKLLHRQGTSRDSSAAVDLQNTIHSTMLTVVLHCCAANGKVNVNQGAHTTTADNMQ
jgi:hypothetical protein